MNWLDLVILVCIAIGILYGIITGIIKQVISLISLIVAILLSGVVAKMIRRWVEYHFQDENHWFSSNVQSAMFYIIAFILIICLFALVAKLVDKIINHTPVGAINKLFGAFFGLFIWTLCLSFLLNFIAVFDNQSKLISKPVKESSIFYDRVKMIFPTLFPYIQDYFKHENDAGR